eukprot:TRINITY_DN1761_c0_g1_i2.p1 TRINITY_DN1761_c0_g1~~TRINITY_DN1761_c0_g1_i2.p1  ORF type:complete len:372 (-),score=94.81 TRINITY_DN1761_c0_g1_i2:120-1235(-)
MDDSKLFVDASDEDVYSTMELTNNNKAILAKGSQINFNSTSGGFVPGYLAKYKDGKSFSPAKILVQNESQNMLLFSPQRKNVVVSYDTETGTPLQQMHAKNQLSDIEMPLDLVIPAEKFSNLRPNQVVETVGISGNMVFNLNWDTRVKGEEIVITDKSEIPSQKGKRFTCVSTNFNGEIAVGSNTGEVHLYSSPAKGWKRSKTKFTQLGDRVIGIDTSYDGEWVVWTTKEYLALVKTTFKVGGEEFSGFKKSMGKHTPPCLLCKISEEDKEKHGIKEVDFTPARFDNSPYVGKAGIIEDNIATSTGEFIIRWNFRKLKLEFEKHMASGSVVANVQPQIFKQSQVVVEKQFEYGENTLVAALQKDLSRLAID